MLLRIIVPSSIVSLESLADVIFSSPLVLISTAVEEDTEVAGDARIWSNDSDTEMFFGFKFASFISIKSFENDCNCRWRSRRKILSVSSHFSNSAPPTNEAPHRSITWNALV